MIYLAATVFPAPLSPLRKERQKYPPMLSRLQPAPSPLKKNTKKNNNPKTKKKTGRKEFSKKCTTLVEKGKSWQDQLTSMTRLNNINMVCGPESG